MESEGGFYIDGFVLLKFIEFQQYKTAYVELAFACHNAVAFSRMEENGSS